MLARKFGSRERCARLPSATMQFHRATSARSRQRTIAARQETANGKDSGIRARRTPHGSLPGCRLFRMMRALGALAQDYCRNPHDRFVVVSNSERKGAALGKNAGGPARIPPCVVALWRDYLLRGGQILFQSAKDLFIDDGPQWAAAVAYYSLLSLFPLLLAGVSLVAFVADPDWVIILAEQRLGSYLPSGGQEVATIVHGAVDARGRAGLLSFIALLWSGSRVFGALTRALNVAFDVDEPYGFFRRLLLNLGMLLTLGSLFALALVSNLALGLLGDTARFFPIAARDVGQLAQAAVPVLLLLLAFLLLYRFVPRGRPAWRAAGVGAIVATLLFLAARPLFLGYIGRFGRYDLIYGSFATVIVLTLWAWIVALITLFGGEVAGHVQGMVLDGQSAAEVGRRRAARTRMHTSSATARVSPAPRAATESAALPTAHATPSAQTFVLIGAAFLVGCYWRASTGGRARRARRSSAA